MKDKHYTVVLCVIAIASILAGCCLFPSPPSVESVEQHFNDNYEEIQTVADFLENSEYECIDTLYGNGSMHADLEMRTIPDEKVCKAVSALLNTGEYKHISKSGNTIYFMQWSGPQDNGCGIAYSINRTDLPEILYMTELVPLPDDGWYYYVDDYNKWRAGARPSLALES